MVELFKTVQREYFAQTKKSLCKCIQAQKTSDEIASVLREIVYTRDDMDFLNKNWERLRKKYNRKWIVISNRKVAYNCLTLEEMNGWLDKHPIELPRRGILHHFDSQEMVY